MVRYGMLIDLDKCTACQACTIACKTENNVPEGVFWHRVIPSPVKGGFPNPKLEIIPRPCMHCKNAPCVMVCPVKATYKREDGLVVQDNDKCIGCGYCIQACPYGVRTFTRYEPEQREYHNPDVHLPSIGVPIIGTVQKCTFCIHRIDKAKKEGRKIGNPDGEVTTACNEICPAGARFFGDLDDPNSEISKQIAARKAVQLLPQYGTEPQVYYAR